jgi:hypothetical protein
MAHYGDLTAIFDQIEIQRREIRGSAGATIREAEARRDQELSRLDRAAAALGGDRGALAPSQSRRPDGARSSPPPKRRRRRRKSATPAVAAQERWEAVLRYMAEQDQPVAPVGICRALAISRHEARTALTRLCKEGKATRTGTGRATRYALRPGALAARALSAVPLPADASLETRLLETIEDRGSASPEELVQATGASLEEVQTTCGALVAAERIRMARRDNRAVYVRRRVA